MKGNPLCRISLVQAGRLGYILRVVSVADVSLPAVSALAAVSTVTVVAVEESTLTEVVSDAPDPEPLQAASAHTIAVAAAIFINDVAMMEELMFLYALYHDARKVTC